MRYEWDERKNLENQRKHNGISFELAALVFEDENCLIGPDRVAEDGEQRWHALGAISIEEGVSAVLLVVHVYRTPLGRRPVRGDPEENRHGEEIIRIISARVAEKHEYRRYQEQEMDRS
jgi:uncharacterized DUF497 family protein